MCDLLNKLVIFFLREICFRWIFFAMVFRISRNGCLLNTYNGISINQNLIKLIFVENGSNLLITWAYNFEIEKGSVDYGLHKFKWTFFTVGWQDLVIFSTIFLSKSSRKSYKVWLSFTKELRRYYKRLKLWSY